MGAAARWRSRAHQVGEQWTTWRGQWEVERELEESVSGSAPILVGPWISEVGYEVLYWIPFLRWVTAAYRIPSSRIVVMSRGGTASWYRDISSRYVEVFDHASLDELAALGTLPGESGQLLRALVARRLAFLVTGGTGSGKTTLLSALLGESDPGDRLVLCEDAAELTPAHPHVVRLLTRPPNVEGVGQVTVRDLVRQALRMRPDRLVVGEVRGAEVADLLAALNTGHDGGCGTLHANRPAEVPARLEALGVAAGLDRAAVHSQAAAALAVVVHLRRAPNGRRVDELGVVSRSGEFVTVESAWRADGGSCPAADGLRDLVGLGSRLP